MGVDSENKCATPSEGGVNVTTRVFRDVLWCWGLLLERCDTAVSLTVVRCDQIRDVVGLYSNVGIKLLLCHAACKSAQLTWAKIKQARNTVHIYK